MSVGRTAHHDVYGLCWKFECPVVGCTRAMHAQQKQGDIPGPTMGVHKCLCPQKIDLLIATELDRYGNPLVTLNTVSAPDKAESIEQIAMDALRRLGGKL